MTKNFHRDGAPTGLHAVAAQSPDGQFGVTLVFGDVLLMFLPEDKFEAYFASVDADQEMDASIVAMLRKAAAQVPTFKATCLKVASAQNN